MTKESFKRPIGADTCEWWAGLATQWKKNMATEWGEIQARLMEDFIKEYERTKGLH